MMRQSQVLWLIAAGVVLVGVGSWLASRHGAGSGAQPAGQVLPLKQDDLNGVTRLRIFKGDGSHTTLTRGTTDWVVTERGYPADSGQVRKLLLDLAALQIEERKTADPTLYSKLGVEDPGSARAAGTGIDIDSHGKTLKLIVGKTSGTRAVYVRVAGQAQSLLVTPQLAPDADPRHWLDRTILDIAPDQVTEVDVTPHSGPAYTIKRSASGDAKPGAKLGAKPGAPGAVSGAAASAAPDYVVSPLPRGRELSDATAPATQAGALAALQLDDVRKPGSAPAVAHARFHTHDGLVLDIAGFQDAEQRYITVAASAAEPAAQQRARDLNARLSGWQLELPGYRYDTLFRPLEQLLKPKASAKHPTGSRTPPHSPLPQRSPLPQQSH